jgi:hypothetical protein
VRDADKQAIDDECQGEWSENSDMRLSAHHEIGCRKLRPSI